MFKSIEICHWSMSCYHVCRITIIVISANSKKGTKQPRCTAHCAVSVDKLKVPTVIWITARPSHCPFICLFIYLVYTWFSASCSYSPPLITTLGTSPSEHIVCLNWKVRREKPTNATKHFKTTFHSPPHPPRFFLSGFLFFSLSPFHLSSSPRKDVYTPAREEEDK